MNIDSKVKVTVKGSFFHEAIGYIRGTNNGMWQVEIHGMPVNGNVAEIVKDR